MKQRSRRVSGRIAKANGATFEADVMIAAARRLWKVIRIPDGGKMVSRTKFIRIPSPFDFVLAKENLFYDEEFLFFDAKTTDKNLFPAAMVKARQLEELSKFRHFRRACAGYVINYEKHGVVSFFSVDQLEASVRTRAGLDHKSGIILGNKYSMEFDQIFQARPIASLGSR